jgi:hypothetical protein
MNTKHTPMTRESAEAAGYEVDTHCYPWLAYKGSRFSPTEKREVFTDKEAALVTALQKYIGYYPAFVSKPIGSPGSQARAKQEYEIALETEARAALKLAQGES